MLIFGIQILQHIWTTEDMLVTLTFLREGLTTLRAKFVFHTSLSFILSYASLTDFHCRLNVFNPLPASGEFCHLLLVFANILDPDQARQNVGTDLDPNCLTL